MGFIYIFTNSSVPSCVAIGCTKSWKECLDRTNTNIRFGGSLFETYLIYEIDSKKIENSFDDNLLNMFGDVHVFNNIYAIKRSQAEMFIESLASARNESDKVQKMSFLNSDSVFSDKEVLDSDIVGEELDDESTKNATLFTEQVTDDTMIDGNDDESGDNVICEDKAKGTAPNEEDSLNPEPKKEYGNEKTEKDRDDEDGYINDEENDGLIVFSKFISKNPQYKQELYPSPINLHFLGKVYLAGTMNELLKFVIQELFVSNTDEFRRAIYKKELNSYFSTTAADSFAGLYASLLDSGIYYRVFLSFAELETLFGKLSEIFNMDILNRDLLVNELELGAAIKKTDSSILVANDKKNLEDTMLRKSNAIKILREYGKRGSHKFKLNGYVTYSSRRADGINKYYWLSPSAYVVNVDWSIILDDQVNKVFYLFNIPKHTFNLSSFAIEKDEGGHDRFSIHLNFDSIAFVDMNSRGKGKSLRGYLVTTCKYSEVIQSEKKAAEAAANSQIIHQMNLVDEIEWNKVHPKQVEYDGTTYEVESYCDLIEIAISEFPAVNGEKITKYLQNESSIYDRPNYISQFADSLKNPHKMKNYGIFVDENIPANVAIKFLKWLAGEAGVDYNSFVIMANIF